MGWIVKVIPPDASAPLYVTKVAQNSKSFGRKEDAKVYQRKVNAEAPAKAIREENGWVCEVIPVDDDTA